MNQFRVALDRVDLTVQEEIQTKSFFYNTTKYLFPLIKFPDIFPMHPNSKCLILKKVNFYALF